MWLSLQRCVPEQSHQCASNEPLRFFVKSIFFKFFYLHVFFKAKTNSSEIECFLNFKNILLAKNEGCSCTLCQRALGLRGGCFWTMSWTFAWKFGSTFTFVSFLASISPSDLCVFDKGVPFPLVLSWSKQKRLAKLTCRKTIKVLFVQSNSS